MKSRQLKYGVRYFTLIEMIVVMGIMGALMALMLPSFNKMINGNKVDQMASNIKLGLEQAQSHAITSRRYVAIVFPNNTGNWNNLTNYCFGGYRLAYVKPEKDGTSWAFVKWIPDQVWRNPRETALLLRVMDSEASDYTTYDKRKSSGEEQNGGGVKNTITALTGAFSDPLKTLSSFSDGSGKYAIVFSPYGGIKIDASAMKLVIGEAIENGNNLIFPSRDANGPTNILILEINKLTGRVDYK